MNNFKLFFLLLATVLAVSCSKDDPVEEPKKPDTPVTPVTPDNPVTPDKPDDQSSGLSALHVDGRFIVNAEGVRVNLHGFAQTYSP